MFEQRRSVNDNMNMNDLLPMFAEDEPDAPSEKTVESMTVSQREHLRGLFAQMGAVTAREQFQIVEEITGQRLNSVRDLTARNAQMLLLQLPARIESRGRVLTGNAWTDRVEDTWIDKL